MIDYPPKGETEPTDDSSLRSMTKIVAPGAGTRATQKRNARRREQRRLNYLRGKGVLDANATIMDLRRYEETQTKEADNLDNSNELTGKLAEPGTNVLLAETSSSGSSSSSSDSESEYQPEDLPKDTDVFMAEKETSQSSPSPIPDDVNVCSPSDPIDQGSAESPKHGQHIGLRKETMVDPHSEVDKLVNLPNSAKQDSSTPKSMTGEMESSIPTDDVTSQHAAVRTPIGGARSTTEEAQESNSPHRRAKLNVSGAKRMLFGSLGLKTPMSKEDEDNTREKLMKNARVLKEPQNQDQAVGVPDLAAIADDDSWRDKIELRAVECCHTGIQLSDPPFPFVQRWDPQQQGGYGPG